MIKKFKNATELKDAIGVTIQGGSRLVSFDNMLLILPNVPKERKKKDIRGILKGLLDEDAVSIAREERKSWR
ncbi:MAG: hypothetical protein OEV28_05575 [Nitrospirota bacterium]|nr:hypothetical protein [Nitrospirota bacterium]